MVTRLIGKDKVLFFVTAKAQKKLRSQFFQLGRLDRALLPVASTSPLEKRLEKWFRTYNSF